MLVPDIMNELENTGEEEQKFDKRKMVYEGYKKLKFIFNLIFRKHPYLASVYSRYLIMEFKIRELSEEHQKYNRNTHTQTHTQTPHARTHTKPKRLPVAQDV